MLKHRVIPVLLLKDNGLVKTYKFGNPRYIGDPINTIRIFNDKEVDELIILDIEASKNGREPNYKMINQLAGECFMPLCYGGGIRTIEQAKKIFALGIEKICIQTAALEDLKLVSDIAARFGSQSVVISVDVKRNFWGRYTLYKSAENKIIPLSWQDFIKKAVDAGIGEVILNAVDRDGTLEGPDLKLITQANNGLSVPLIALGGIGKLSDIKAAVDAGASAVAAGAFFVFHGPYRSVLISYPSYHDLEVLFENR